MYTKFSIYNPISIKTQIRTKYEKKKKSSCTINIEFGLYTYWGTQ